MEARIYSLGQRWMAYILLFSFFLQSCGNFSNPIIPTKENKFQINQRENNPKIDRQREEANELMAQGGHTVTIYEKEGQLQAMVEENLPEGFNKTYRRLPVYMEAGTNPAEIALLDKKLQERLVEVKLPTSGQLGHVYIGKRGLMGGMRKQEISSTTKDTKKKGKKNTDEQEKDGAKDQEEVKKKEGSETSMKDEEKKAKGAIDELNKLIDQGADLSDQDYTVLGEALYLALNNEHPKRVDNIVNKFSSTKDKPKLDAIIGYTLYLAAKNSNLKTIDAKLASKNVLTRMGMALSLLKAIQRRKSKELQTLSKSFIKHIDNGMLSYLLDKFVDQINQDDNESAQEDFLFLANHIEIPDTLLDGMRKNLRSAVTAPKEGLSETKKEEEIRKNKEKIVREFLKKITAYQNIEKRLRFAIPLPAAHLGIPISYNVKKPISADRKKGNYSDSEEEYEESPHFNGVYNLTKYGILNIEEQSTFDGFEKEFINNYVTDYADITPNKLKKDAETIHKSLKEISKNFPIDRVTILCVALRQNDGRIKKFVFTTQLSVYQFTYSNHSKKCFSTKETMQAIVKKAHELGYHVVMAQQAHAEAEFMQFLQERPTRYTHIISMGCSREHCLICGKMLEKVFRPDMVKKTSGNGVESTDNKYDRWLIPSALDYFLKKQGYDILQDVVKSTRENILFCNEEAKQKYWKDQNQEKHKKLNSKTKWDQRLWAKSKHIIRKENTPTPVQSAADNRQQAEKQIHQPILRLPSRTQLPPMIIYPSSQSTEQVHGKKKHQRMQQLKTIQPLTDQEKQELHTSILQTLQNPIWKRYALSSQLTTTQLLPDTQLQLPPTQGHYQLACVQESFQPLVPMLSLQTREKYHIILVQDMGYWWGIIQDKRPGFSRNMVLPVLYPNHANGEELSLSTQYTVEALIQMDPAVQQQLVHIFSRDRSLKNGFVYTGEEMGLVGGCKKRNNETEVARKRTEQKKRAEEMNRRKKAARDKIEQEKRIIQGEVWKANRKESVAKGTIPSEVSKISSGTKGYTGLPAVLASLDNEKKETLACINELKASRDSFTKNSAYSEHILPQDYALCDKAIKDMEQHNGYIEQERKSVIAIVEQRAEADFQRTQGDWDKMAQSEITKVNDMLKSNWVPQVSDNPQAAIDRIQANIRECEDFKKGVELLPNIRKKVDEQLQREKARLADIIQKVKTLMENPQPQAEELPKKNENAAKLQELANATDPVEVKNLAISALECGECNLLEFAIKTKELSVQATDSAGDTLLHQAVKNNQLDVVELLLKCGAKKDAVNERVMKTRKAKITPETLAAGNKEMEELLKKWK